MVRRFFRRPARILLALLLAGCTPSLLHQLDKLYGPADPERYAVPVSSRAGVPEYWHDVRPVLESRCVVCHGCYDAPCQLNLTAWDGIARGANPDMVYSNRLNMAEPSRLFIDAVSPVAWRAKNFHPVLNEREDTAEANLQGSVLYRLLDLKRQHPLPSQPVLNDRDFTFSLDRKQTCPKIEAIDRFGQEHPLWGMPYGLPAVSAAEFSTLEQWLAAGAPVAERPALPAELQQQVAVWERFFNGETLKQQLVARYLYEHLFLAHLYFTGQAMPVVGERFFFRLVRSSTPPGTPIAEIPTRRPFDDPGSNQFWYRLRLDSGSIVDKTHMPYALNAQRLKKWQHWFLEPEYTVSALPGYSPEVASNPFVAFESLPVNARYRFLLDEARFAIDNFIKGPVCRGQVALGVIDDRFWVFFVDPDAMDATETAHFLAEQKQFLRLPGEDASNARVVAWLKYSRLQKAYLKAKQQELEQGDVLKRALTEGLVWDGDHHNDNAALTIFRHADSATVVKGLVGDQPKTSWIVGYSLLERIHYLLVAGYDVYGSMGHQLNTRLYMDFMRMEGEANFLALLPKFDRVRVRDYWYRDADDNVKDYLFGTHFNPDIDTGIVYQSKDSLAELYARLVQRVKPVMNPDAGLAGAQNKPVSTALKPLSQVRGKSLSWFPQNSILRVEVSGHAPLFFTLINNSGFSNNSELFGEDKRRRPDEDTLTVVPGFLGAYPNAFFTVSEKELDNFAASVSRLGSEQDYTVLADRFAIRRTNPQFWSFSDAVQHAHRQQSPVTAGLLDYNRFENR